MTNAEADNDIYNIEKIVDFKQKGNKRVFLVKWEGYPSSQNTWEDEENIFAKEMIDQYFEEKKSKAKKPAPTEKQLKPKEPSKRKSSLSQEPKKTKNIDAEKAQALANANISETGELQDKKTVRLSSNDEKRFTKDMTALTKSYSAFLEDFETRVHTENVTNEFDYVIENVIEVWSCDNQLWARVVLKNGELGVFSCKFLHLKAPVKLLDYYESMIVFTSEDEPNVNK